MKILYLQLKNFANIYTAMHVKNIEIDFTRSKNRVILLIGKNGSGKTSILSELQPFAYAGNMDVRNASNLILENKDGYKEIHIQHNDDKYTIRHYYKNGKKGITLKSFIAKNGIELNVNGNVTSFYEYVSKELSLEPDYMKLLRLGSNVTNFIEMKASERKNFTSDLLSDIDTYNQLYKKINEDARVLRNLIKTVSDKINRLHIQDKELIESEIKDLQTFIDKLKKEHDDLQNQLGTIDGTISALVPNGVDSFINELDDMKKKVMRMSNESRQCIRDLSNHLIILVGSDTITEYTRRLENNLKTIESEYTVLSTKLDMYSGQRNELYNKRDEVQDKLKNAATSMGVNELSTMYKDLTMKKFSLDKRFGDNKPVCGKDMMMTALNILMEINRIAHTIYEFDPLSIRKTVQMIRDGINIDSYVEKEIASIDSKIGSNRAMCKSNHTIVLYRPPECIVDDCPYFYLDNYLSGKTKISDDTTKLESDRDKLLEMSAIGKNIDYILIILKSNASVAEATQLTYLNIESILDSICKLGNVYDESYIVQLVSDIEDYEDYISLKTKLIELQNELNKAKNNSDTIELLKETLYSTNVSISAIEHTIAETRKLLHDISIKREHTITNIEDAKDYSRIKENKTVLDKEIETLLGDIQNREKILTSIQGHLSHRVTIQSAISETSYTIKQKENDLFEKCVALRDFESLTNERRTLTGTYDDIVLIRESLSSNKGIPLLYIQLYLKNTKLFVNELLSSVYTDEEFEIDDFEINATEFSIPYIKNGVRINDVVYASQGERSFLSLALSFAMITQSIKNYNILLLDELDSTLDYKNRPLFLNILEKQMNSIDAEQVFLITHNDMFDSYPVDIIATSPLKHGNTPNQNVIFSRT